jgi:glycosyltransferase involved in cell wall biosynthesis
VSIQETTAAARSRPQDAGSFPQPFRLSVLMPVYNERFLVEAAVRRVLAFRHPMVKEVELIIVDDASTDGTTAILRRLAAEFPAGSKGDPPGSPAAHIRLFEQPRNQGKGAAVRRAIAEATGAISVIQDADLEYNPEDWALLLQPFLESDADAVFGSRFASSEYRRVLTFWHTQLNRFLTLLSNLMTDLDLTDMETCYKMVRTELLKSIPIRSNDFSMEPEITAKLAKRGVVIYEVPIRYAGRTQREGKKISARHGVTALLAILRWKLIDDIYQKDAHGSEVLNSLNNVHQFNRWTAEELAGEIGSRVLEIGAGIGNLTLQFLPRPRYLATDINPNALAFLRNLAVGKPYLEVRRLDVLDAAGFRDLAGQFDTVLCLNLLEHLDDPLPALRNASSALTPGGKLVVLVPQGPGLHTSLDRAVGHRRRFRRDELVDLFRQAGLRVASLRDFNRLGVPGWYWNGRVLQRQRISLVQLKLFNTLCPSLSRLDPLLPWPGLSLIAVGQRVEGQA